MQKTPINKKFKNRKAIKNSLTLNLTLFQLAKRQIGTNKVVNRIKKREIPSIPKVKFNVNNGNHFNLAKN
jgi:hypothetical protein